MHTASGGANPHRGLDLHQFAGGMDGRGDLSAINKAALLAFGGAHIAECLRRTDLENAQVLERTNLRSVTLDVP